MIFGGCLFDKKFLGSAFGINFVQSVIMKKIWNSICPKIYRPTFRLLLSTIWPRKRQTKIEIERKASRCNLNRNR